jgi:hypothetical protein
VREPGVKPDCFLHRVIRRHAGPRFSPPGDTGALQPSAELQPSGETFALVLPAVVPLRKSRQCKRNAWRTMAFAPSVAKPRFQWSADSRQPISTHGVNAAGQVPMYAGLRSGVPVRQAQVRLCGTEKPGKVAELPTTFGVSGHRLTGSTKRYPISGCAVTFRRG